MGACAGQLAAADQLVPFQCSMSGMVAELVYAVPTAQQSLVPGQETFDSMAVFAPLMLGVVSIAHLVPFQPSASVALPLDVS